MSSSPSKHFPYDLIAFGMRLRKLRIGKGITSVSKLAEKTGFKKNGTTRIKADRLSEYERGLRAPQDETCSLLARALEISVEELVADLPLRASGARPVEKAQAVPVSSPTGDEVPRLLVPGTSRRPGKPSPSQLLSARYQWVPFVALRGQTQILKELRKWCSDEEPVAARLFYGGAGTGKTRLLIEWCSTLKKEKDWTTGFLVEKASAVDFEKLMKAATHRSTLVVIDYAESRQDLVALMEMVARRRNTGSQGQFRLVLLARSMGDWWEALVGRNAMLTGLLNDVSPVEVAADELEPSVRGELFRQAAKSFAEVLGLAAPARVPEYLKEPRFDRVLLIHMASLAEVAGLPVEGREVREGLLEHEERFWRVWQESASQGEPPDVARRQLLRSCRQAVTALTLVGGATSGEEARELLLHACRGQEGLLLVLRDLYPGAWESAGQRYVGTLEPDHLGAALVLRTLEAERAEAGRWLKQVFAVADEQAWRRSFEILGRLCLETDQAKKWVEAVLEGHAATRSAAVLEAAISLGAHAGGQALDGLLAGVLEREGTVEVARKLSKVLLPKALAGLPQVSKWVKARLTRRAEP